MQCLRTLGVLSVTLSLVWSMTLETTSTRPNSHDTDNDINHIPDTNSSTLNILDVRTPPRVQSQIKDKLSSKYSVESSHAGVAIPVDEDVAVEESTNRANFYKLDRPTTASGGLSTWILLSGQTSSTSPKSASKKPSVKPIIMKDEKSNETLMLSDKPLKIVKPIFKQRSTTAKPVTSTSTKTTTVRINTFSPSSKTSTRKPAKITKVKASLLQSMVNNKLTNSTIKNDTITDRNSTTKAPKYTTTTTLKTLTEPTRESTSLTTIQPSASLPVEAKDGEQALPSSEASKKKTQKKKKNKNRRRKPSKASKEGNNKLKEVESPGTQLYSYLRSEIIPVTVGVSLVGLLVTAGLASYYLQPFAALRRTDPIDRKDTGGGYYYQDDYTNAMPEEEAIGKVIAGMPENALQENSGSTFKQPSSKKAYPQNVRYRHVDRRSQIYMNPYGSVEDVKLHDRTQVNYEHNYNGDKKFVVGSVQTEAVPEVTPAVVPEHGPRNLKDVDRKFVVGSIPEAFYSDGAAPRSLQIRKRRDVTPNDMDNEIFSGENEIASEDRLKQSTTDKIDVTTITTVEETTSTIIENTEETSQSTTPHNVFSPSGRPNTLFELITDLFKLKVRLGLELIQNLTSSVSTYVSKVHTRLDEHYRKATKENRQSKAHFH